MVKKSKEDIGEEQRDDTGPIKRISATKIKELLKETRGAQSEIDEISGEMGSSIKSAVETHGLNRKIFGWIRQLDRMEPEKLAMMLDDFDDYVIKAGLRARAKSAPSFDSANDQGEGEGARPH